MRVKRATISPAFILAAILGALVLAAPSAAAVRVKEFVLANPGEPRSVARAPDGSIWFTSDFTGNKIGRVSTGGIVSEFPLPRPRSAPDTIVAGPDGNMWFTERDGNRIGRITPQGAITEFPLPTPGSRPRGMTVGPDGALWFTEFGRSRIGRITTGGAITEFAAGISPGAAPLSITRGPDGALWFTEPAIDRIGRITTAGVVVEHPGPSNLSGPEQIALGADGRMWFTEEDGDRIGRITRSGAVREFVSGIRPGANPFGITRGTDDAMWFTEFAGDRIARITPAGIVTEYRIPAGSEAMGIVAAPGRRLWVAAFGRNRILRVKPPPPPAVDASIAYSFTTAGSTTSFTRLVVSDVPRYARVELRCKGGGCRKKRIKLARRSRMNLRSRVPDLRSGARLEVRVRARGLSTQVRRFRMRSGKVPRVRDLCVPPKSRKTRSRCG